MLADFVLLNDPTADSDGAVNCTMALTDFQRYFTGRAIALRAKERGSKVCRPQRTLCELVKGEEPGVYAFLQRGQSDPLPEDFSGWVAASFHDGIAHATTAHRTFRRMERTAGGSVRFGPEQLAQGGRYSVYAVDQTGSMRVAEVRLPVPEKPPEAFELDLQGGSPADLPVSPAPRLLNHTDT